ncbi:hypothetical protein P879_02057 [Paragonimus westermani]|uniref:Vacuolar protein sorting-associated protein 51 homolog n=1 Tax=Paragonimus westermani TaxID=34504 RepID=A0A8T0DVD7_9TREM|nr:hypothetical protein P879_02057 [Paragonimus westermani]
MKEDTYRKTVKEKLLQAGSHPNHSDAAASPVHEDSQTDVFNIDGPTFHAQSYMDKHLREKDLSDLMLEEKVLTEQIRTLDSEMQTLMYDNYSKFISATDTIRMMKSDFKFVENEMNSLVKNMSSIGSLSDKIRSNLTGERSKLKTLVDTQQTLNKVACSFLVHNCLIQLKYLVELPGRLQGYVVENNWDTAVKDLNQAKFILKSYHNTPSFKNIRRDCHQIVFEIQRKLWEQFEGATGASEFHANLKILKQLGIRNSKLSSSFIEHAKDRLHAIIVDLQVKDLCEDSSSSDTPDVCEQVETVESAYTKTHSNLLRCDLLRFANLITESVLHELTSFVTAYTNLFAVSNVDASDDFNTIIENVDLEPVALEARLADLVEEVLDNFFKLTEERFADDQQACSETPLLVRAVDRFHSRVQLFTRTFTSAIHSMVTATTDDLTGDQYEMVPRPNENLPEIYGQQTRQLCERFARRALDLVHSVAQARTEFYRTKLCQSAIDSITDLRQQLVSPSLQIGPGQVITSNSITGQEKDADHLGQLSRLSDMLNSTLVTQLKGTLKALEVFLNPDNTFTSRACFSEQFCLLQLRERLIVGHLKFLLDFLDDLAKTAAGRVPSPILLLLAKLCYSWANSGTLGHLLTLPEELLSHGSKRWSSSTNLTSPGCQVSSVPSVPFDPNSPPTTSKSLTDSYRQVSTQLLVAFVRLEGTNLAQLLRKSVEARDWLKNLEPRSVRSVVKRVIEDLSLLDRQIGQLFPSYSRGHKDRLSDTRSVRSGHTSSLRPTGSSHFLDKVSRPGSTGLPATSNELDPSLATQLRRLFTQRVDIFASVEANRDSLLLGVIKIGLKTLVECVRLQTFGKFGLQQIQVDCRFLQIHLWHFVSDEKLIGMLLDDVIYSVVQRCVDPQLMDESIVDAICDRV